jgi:very-short-patch-repair endonuclease
MHECIQNTKKVIECYGDFWHANPNLFKDQEKILIGTTRVKDVWNKDKDRQKILEDLGYKVLVLWEQDINNNLEQVKEQIRNFLNE